MKKYLSVKNICSIAVLGALGAVLMLFDFPIAVAPNFYKLDLGDLPCLIGAFSMGPVPALLIQIIKILIKLLLKPTSTAFVGELAAFIFSSVYCVSAAYIYSLKKDKKQAVKALIIASILMIITAAAANYLFIIPFYVRLYNIPLDVIINMGKAIFPVINGKLMFVLLCVIPFNGIKALIVGILTMLLYKRVSPLLK
ncbi:MAG: ECF transporter S component [Erysipelotrichaceae bacterium]|nr:ECF transporter S component [Erysipelotrichaceae bacterium]